MTEIVFLAAFGLGFVAGHGLNGLEALIVRAINLFKREKP